MSVSLHSKLTSESGISEGMLTGAFYSAGMHAFWPSQAVSREQLADDGAVRSQRFDCEHHAGVSTVRAAGLRVWYSQEVVSDFKRIHFYVKCGKY